MKTRSFVILVSVVTVIALVSTTLTSEADPSSGRDMAERGFRDALQNNPADLEARIGLTRVLLEKEQLNKAVAVMREGMKADPDRASLLRVLAEVASTWGRDPKEPQIFEVAERSLNKLVDAGAAGAETFKLLGYVQKRLGEHLRCADSCAVALRLDPEDVFNKGRLGYAYTLAGKYEKGLPLIVEAVEQTPDDYLLLWWLGDTQRLLGHHREAYRNLRRALRLAPRYQHARLGKVMDFTRRLLSARKGVSGSSAHRFLGARHRDLGRLDKTLAAYEKALELLPSDEHREIGACNRTLGITYSQLFQLDLSLEYMNRAVDAYRKCSDYRGLKSMCDNIAICYYKLSYTRRAREKEFLEKAIGAAKMGEHYARKTGEASMVLDALVHLCTYAAEAYGVDDPRVEEYRRDVRERIPETRPVTDEITARAAHCEARMQLLERNNAAAKELYKMAASYFAARDDYDSALAVPGIYSNLATVCLRNRDVDEAIMYGEEAVSRFSHLRSMVGIDEFKRTGVTRQWQWLFADTLVPATLEQGDKIKAFDYVEQYKGRALLDLLGSKGPRTKHRTYDKKRMEKSVALARLGELERQAEVARSQGDSASLRSFERTLSIEKTNYERLAEDVSVTELELKSLEDVDSLKAKDLQPVVKDFTLVSYVVGHQDSHVTVLSVAGVEAATIDGASEEKLRELIEVFRRQIGVESAMPRDLALELEREEEAPAEEPEKPASRELYELLIEPILPFIKTKLVYISPDSVLTYLPFEALKKDGKYLIEDYAIAYAPSGSVLKICMDRNRNRRESVLALGNPNLKNPAFRLVHAENEVKALEGMFPQVDVYTGDDATELVVAADGPDYDILHFACHGELNLDEPMLTSLRLAPDDENDGYLHAGEVFEHDLSASLVVLSACNSALGELTMGNELMGLTRSFLYAGVPSIVASLWTVDDRSTSYLMQQFYRNLGTMNKADALREAKLATMREYPSPFHWAAFCLQGDYR